MAPSLPSQIGKYEVIEILGRGGMGVVYLGFDRHLGRQVAIKTLTEGFVQDPEMLKRFYREAKKTGALMHPNIVIIYDLGEQDGFPYIVMEYVSGEPLDKIIRSGRQLTVISKLRVIEQVCLALGYAHRNDVIHRDVKPANVIVQQDDNAKLLDFGIAHHEQEDRYHRLTKVGNLLGTMNYMAPERWRGELFDGRSDIFSAGVMLYELLAGHLPFYGEDAAVFHQILHEPCPPLGKYLADYPLELDAVIQRALSKNPEDRHGNAEEMAAEIAAVAEQLRKAKGAEMLQRAAQFFSAEDYLRARDLLSQLIKLDSKNVDARKLLATVQSSLAVRQRADQVQQLKLQARAALDEQFYGQAIALLEQALQLEPLDVEAQQWIEEIRTWSEETVQRCYQLMESSPQQALTLVQEQLRQFPSQERLLILQSAIEERLAHLKLEEARSHYMSRAHEAIRSQRYREAAQVLEGCLSEGILSDEITDLLEFARHEARRKERSALIETTAAKAHALISQGWYDQAISLLEPVAAQLNEQSLRVVLENARSERHSEQRRLQSVLETLRQLMSFQQWDEAITFLEDQLAAVQEKDSVKSVLAELRMASDREGRILRATGTAYAALHQADLQAAHQNAEVLRQIQAPSELATKLVNSLETRLTQAAGCVVTTALSEARAALQEHDPKQAVDILDSLSLAKTFATVEIRQAWQELRKQAGRARLLGRFGIQT